MLVSFKVAQLAKRKGYNIIPRFSDIASLYDKKGNHVYYSNYGFMGSGVGDGYIPAPTQSDLQKWLREKHKIHINMNFFSPKRNKHWTQFYFYIGTDLFKSGGLMEIANTMKSFEKILDEGLEKALKEVKFIIKIK